MPIYLNSIKISTNVLQCCLFAMLSYFSGERASCFLSACVIAVKKKHSYEQLKAYKGKAYSNVSDCTKVKLAVKK